MKRHSSDILFLALVFLVVLATTTLPYWLQARNAPSGTQFGGIVFALADQNTYLMWMRQAAEGQVVWRDLMTSDPHQPFYTNLMWLALGRMAGKPENLLLAYHAGRVVFSLLLLIAVYALLGALLKSPWERRVALLLIATGDGLCWVFFWLNRPGPAGVPVGTEAFAAPELLAWPSMALLPHFAAALAAMAGVFYFALAAYQRPARWAAYAAAGGLLLAVLAGFHVYDVVTVGVVLVAHWIVLWRAGQAGPHTLRALLLILAPGAAVTLLVGAMLARSPIGRAWQESNLMLSWSPLAYAVGLGIPLLVALADHKRLFHWREMTVAERLPPIWLLVSVPLLFTDGLIPFERRLMMGIQIPVVVLAATNWSKYVVPRWAPAGRAGATTLAWGILLALTWPGLALRINYYATQPASYLSEDFLALTRRLATLRPDGVLCRAPLGNWLPQLSGQPVYVGHGELTPGFLARREQVEQFFDPATTDQAQRKLLTQAGCWYVLAEREDRAALAGGLRQGWLEPVLALPGASLYQANPGPAYEQALLHGHRRPPVWLP